MFKKKGFEFTDFWEKYHSGRIERMEEHSNRYKTKIHNCTPIHYLLQQNLIDKRGSSITKHQRKINTITEIISDF